MGDSRAVTALGRLATDSSSQVRQAAVTALGSIGDSRAARVITAALRDPDKHVRLAAAEALGRLRTR